MSNVGIVMAKLAGIRKAVARELEEKINVDRAGGRLRTNFGAGSAHHFLQATELVDQLRTLLPDLYGDFHVIQTKPLQEMAAKNPDGSPLFNYSRGQLEQLARDVDQIIEIRANSELVHSATARTEELKRVFVSHGRSKDWLEVQAYIEKDIGLSTIELAQEASAGQTIIEKLEANSAECDSAVIVMTGDDLDSDGQARARENVIHEIGFFHGKYGRARVCLLHEEGVSIPSNLSGIVYVPFPKGYVSASFGVLVRELKSMYKL
ncbi:putative nucleotide-binding protein [Paraburkholderia sp. UCT70]|uniref:TIR domain-containing protein n=1 Tax=Paraburkholderia sp. UCT70 TaxID=2991068 RepID=UPI003D1ED6F6